MKNIIKKSKLAIKINSLIKEQKEKYAWNSLTKKYSKSQKILDEKYILEAVKAKIKRKINSQSKKNTELIYVGTDENQDYSGFAQAIKKLFKVHFYLNKDEKYGLNLCDKNGMKTFHDPYISKENSEKLIELAENILDRSNLVIVGQMMSNFIDADCLERLSMKNIPIINISMDDKLSGNWSYYRGRKMGAIGLAKYIDITLTTSPEVLGWYAQEGADAIFFPLASSPELFGGDPSNPHRSIDVLFIGNRYGIRSELIDYLRKSGISVSVWGQGWHNGVSDFKKSIELGKQAKIILGVGNVGHVKDKFTLKLRDFDGPMSGALYITHRSEIISKIFDEGKDVILYSDYNECAEKIKYYLDHERERISIATNGQIKVKNKYSWDAHLKKTFTEIGLL